jgi:predicted SAM-dependent methyltransferase
MSYEYVQYGCGFCAPEGWMNFDSSPTLRFERLPIIGNFYTKNKKRFPLNVRYGDIVKGLPIDEDSCKGVYCSHVLEHLSLEDFRIALQKTYSYLRPGGIFRLVVPDLEELTCKYLKDARQDAAIRFIESCCLGAKNRPKTIVEVLLRQFSNSAHLWMWDEKAVVRELEQHGFRCCRRARFGDCEDKRFQEVEDLDRFVDAVAIESVK